MKWVLRIPLLLLVTTSTRHDDIEWRNTRNCHGVTLTAASVDASTASTEPDTSPASSSASVATTEAPAAAAPQTSARLHGAIEPHSASDNPPVARGVRSSERKGRSDDASRGKSTSPPDRSGTVGRGEESGTGAAVENDFRLFNWIPWLPEWTRQLPPYGPLGVPAEPLLEAFSDGLGEFTAWISTYWIQEGESAETDEKPSTEEQQTRLLLTVMKQVHLLQTFYKWMNYQLNSTESSGYYPPDAVGAFLFNMHYQTALVESVCNWSPSMRSACNAADSKTLNTLSLLKARQLVWLSVFYKWVGSRYYFTVGPRLQRRWWLTSDLNEDVTLFNVSHLFTSKYTSGKSASRVKANSNGVCTTKDGRGENCEDTSCEASAHRNYWSGRQLEPQEKPYNQEGKLSSEREAEKIPMRAESGTSLDQVWDELGAASARPHDGVDGYNGIDDYPDEGFSEEEWNSLDFEERTSMSMVVVEQDEEQEPDTRPRQIVPDSRNIRGCWETPVLQELGSDFDPDLVTYVRCNEEGKVCDLPEKCMPQYNVISVKAQHRATLPDFPHTVVGEKEMPDGRVSLKLLVATSCACAPSL